MKQLKNFLIKREQSQTRLSFAECEKSRLIAKLSLTLVALLSMTTGAWAQNSDEVTVTPVTGQTNKWTFTMPAFNVELTPIYAPEFTAAFKAGNDLTIQGGKATVTLTGDWLINDGSHGGWYCQSSNKTATISVAEANGANITSVKFYTAGGGSAEDKDAPFEVTTTTVTSSNITTYLNGNSIGSYGVSKIEVYGTK